MRPISNQPLNQSSKFQSNKFQLSWLLIYPFFLVFIIEWIQRTHLRDTLVWVINNATSVFLTYLVVLMVFLFFYGLFNRLWAASLLTTLPLLILAFLNFFKTTIRGEPLLPWDLFLSKEAMDIVSSVPINFTVQQIIFMGTFILIVILLIIFQKMEKKLNFPGRITALLIATISLFSLYSDIFLDESKLMAYSV